MLVAPHEPLIVEELLVLADIRLRAANVQLRVFEVTPGVLDCALKLSESASTRREEHPVAYKCLSVALRLVTPRHRDLERLHRRVVRRLLPGEQRLSRDVFRRRLN